MGLIRAGYILKYIEHVALHSYHFYVEEGLLKTRVLLWVYGEQLRAVLDNVVDGV